MNSEKSEEADWSEDGGIAAVLKASTQTDLKFACLVRFIDAGHILRKEILDAVLYLVSDSIGSVILLYFRQAVGPLVKQIVPVS